MAAVTVAEPCFRAVNTPLLLTFAATDGATAQVTFCVTSRDDPSLYVPVTASCLVVPLGMEMAEGLIESLTSLGELGVPSPPQFVNRLTITHNAPSKHTFPTLDNIGRLLTF